MVQFGQIEKITILKQLVISKSMKNPLIIHQKTLAREILMVGCLVYIEGLKVKHTANVCRELQGLYREIGVQGFQIYGDYMYTRNPCNF